MIYDANSQAETPPPVTPYDHQKALFVIHANVAATSIDPEIDIPFA
jgi:hypothetical protein